MQWLSINYEIEEAQDKDERERRQSAVRYALSCHFEWTNWKKRGKSLVVLCLIEDAVFVSKRLVIHLFPGHSGCSQALINCWREGGQNWIWSVCMVLNSCVWFARIWTSAVQLLFAQCTFPTALCCTAVMTLSLCDDADTAILSLTLPSALMVVNL